MRKNPPALMIFAAGFGTRMRPLTLDRPKPLIEVAGRTLIDHTLMCARAINPDPVVVNLHYKAEMLEAHLADKGVTTIVEHPDILDTGGGLKNALPVLGQSEVVTSNSDAIWIGPNPFALLLDHWDAARMDALLVCVPRENCIGRQGTGDFDMNADGHLARGTQSVYGGVQMIKTEALHDESDPVFSLNRVWDQANRNARLFGVIYPGRWCDIGTPEGIGLAETALEHAADV